MKNQTKTIAITNSLHFSCKIFIFITLCLCSHLNFGSRLAYNSSPIIVELFPAAAQQGSTLSISGTDLLNIESIAFPSVILNQIIPVSVFTIVGEGLLLVNVPSNIASGVVTISGTDGTASSPQPFTYLRKQQSIDGLNPNTILTFGANAISLSGNNLENTLSINVKSNPSSGVVSLVGHSIKIIGVGTATITGTMNGNVNYEPLTAVGIVQIQPAPLSINAYSYAKIYGEPTPTFSGSVTGIVGSAPIAISYISKVVDTTSVGEYPIDVSVSGTNISNYIISTIGGTFTISKANQFITFPTIPGYKLGNSKGYMTLLGIKASSGLPVDIQVQGNARLQSFTEGVAILEIDSVGIVSVSGSQSGNQNYHPAPSVVRLLEISSDFQITDSTKVDSTATITTTSASFETIEIKPSQVYPNPNSGTFTVDIPKYSTIKLINQSGFVENVVTKENSQTITVNQKGILYLSIPSGKSNKTIKILIRDE